MSKEKVVIGQTQFTDEKEAIKTANDMNATFASTKVCPLLRGLCDTTCICFIPAFPYKNPNDPDGGIIRIGGLKCGNAMFHGNKAVQ